MKISISLLKVCGVYTIEVKTPKKIYRYIGSGKNIYHRLHSHKSYLRKGKHQNAIMQNLYNKYGESSFSCSLIESCKEHLLTKQEQKYINIHAPYINITKEVIRNTPSKSSRKKISDTLKRKNKSGEIQPSGSERRPVDVYTLEGKFIETLPSLRAVSKAYNLSESKICLVCQGKRASTGGYQLRYAGDKCTGSVLMKSFSTKYDILINVSGKKPVRLSGIINLYYWLKDNIYKYPKLKYTITTSERIQPDRKHHTKF